MEEQHYPMAQQWSLDRLIPFARNLRTHSDSQIAQIVGSIVAFGFNVPILLERWNHVFTTLVKRRGR